MPVEFNMDGLNKFAAGIRDAMKSTSEAHPIRQSMNQWGAVYRSEMKERFSRLSRGGGEWDDLKPSTIARRRKGKGRTVKAKGKTKKVAFGTVAILIDKGTLFAGMDPDLRTDKGAIQKHIPFGITVGYGGQAKHEPKPGQKGAPPTIAAIASYHQAGSPPDMAARPIIVAPSAKTMARIVELTEAGMKKLWKQSTA